MDRRSFLSITGTLTGGALILPNFLYSLGSENLSSFENQSIVFIQLNGGNDGLNTFIPITDPLYFELRPKIAISKKDAIDSSNAMAFHPNLKNLAKIQQNGDLCVIQNVGYPDPVRSHFRSQEIWQTAPKHLEYESHGWLGRFLDSYCQNNQPTAGINIDNYDNLAFFGKEPNSMTINDIRRFQTAFVEEKALIKTSNPQLDFVRKIATSLNNGNQLIQNAIGKTAPSTISYPKNILGRNLEWISKLIKGGLNSKVYYTSMNGFDTHEDQIARHKTKLSELDDSLYCFYKELKEAKLLENVTIVVFSEFGRRVKENGNGTDHGTAAPVFVVGGKTKGKIIGSNPNLNDLDEGDLKHEIDFRSVYATLLKEKMNFDSALIGINNKPLRGLF